MATGPPHFHARAAGHSAKVRIDTLEVLASDLSARTPEGFAEVNVDPETGTVCWPGGADLAPDTLYERVRTGVWPGQSQAA